MSANEYSVIVVTEEFLSGGTWSRNEYDNPEGPPLQFLQDNASNTTMFQNLSTVDCITAYQNSLVVGRRNILAVTTNRDAGKAMNNTVVRVMSSSPTDVLWDIDPLAWICDDIPGYNSSYLFNTGLKLCDANLVIKSASTWKISNQKIDYCLSEKVSEECKLQFSLNLMIVVISCNVVKMLCLFFTVWKQKQTLVTIGCIAALCITSILLDQGVQSLKQFGQPTSVGALWSMGFGAVNANAILFPGTRSRSTPATLLRSVLLGNLPQVILSFLYLMYNSLYTNMLLAHEWSQFAQVRKALRVTSPTGRQRSTYFLQLPYKYAIPLVISSGLMHWLVSQSIFLAHVTVLTNRGVEDPAADMTTCGYSCIAIIFVIIVGSLMVLAVIATGFRRLDPGIPLASSCSIAISAACHPPQDDVNAAILPVMWGAVEEKNEDVGHCTFTSMEVTPPVKGRLYAGLAGHTSGGKSTAVDLTECSNGGPSWV
ncbi:MAG: hypothetical protein M1830_007578 [Pleopsidium flavum]|nr:MAG: hypothetical protein M1830_007578 [Pleopsidium flavum]